MKIQHNPMPIIFLETYKTNSIFNKPFEEMTKEDFAQNRKAKDEFMKAVKDWEKENQPYYDEIDKIEKQREEKCSQCKHSTLKSRCYSLGLPKITHECTIGFSVRETGYCKKFEPKGE